MVTFEAEIDGASEASISRFLAAARKAVRLRGKVNVLVTTNREMRSLNRRFRAKDKPTDVLSFPAPDGIVRDFAGDIAISAQIASASARDLGISIMAELKILVLHGLLHLAGYDHESDDGQMARKERKLRRELKLPEGLIERTVRTGRRDAVERATREEGTRR